MYCVELLKMKDKTRKNFIKRFFDSQKEWYLRNKDYMRQKKMEWYQQNRERILEEKRKQYIKDKRNVLKMRRKKFLDDKRKRLNDILGRN